MGGRKEEGMISELTDINVRSNKDFKEYSFCFD